MNLKVLALITVLASSCGLGLGDKDIDISHLDGPSYSDIEGDVIFDFVDITEVKLVSDDHNIYVQISLSDIPDELSYNAESVSDNALEYEWSISFDVDRNEEISNNIEMSVSRFHPGFGKPKKGGLLDFTQKNVWIVSESTSGSAGAFASASIQGNHLIIAAPKSEVPDVTIDTPFTVSTYYNFEGALYKDIYPDDGGYQR